MEKIGLVGGAGYIGSVAANYFNIKGYKVTIFDSFLFDNKNFFINKDIKCINYDSRNFDKNIFKSYDLVIDLAAISNDPAGELDPLLTNKVNVLGRINTVNSAISSGVKYFIMASSCSVYGESIQIVDELSTTSPLTTYAKANLEVEEYIKSLDINDFNPLIFRQATVFGLSPRLRLDLVVNALIYYGYKENKIKLLRDGTQWRPLVGVNDLAYLYEALEPNDFIKNRYQVFNIGFNSNNYQIKNLGDEIISQFKDKPSIEWYGDPDKRSYRVNFSKAENFLPIKKIDTIKKSSKELLEYFQLNNYELTKFNITLDWYKDLIESKKLVF